MIFKNHEVNWDPPWRISIHRDFDSLGVPFHPVVVIGLGKNLLLKSVLGHCVLNLLFNLSPKCFDTGNDPGNAFEMVCHKPEHKHKRMFLQKELDPNV